MDEQPQIGAGGNQPQPTFDPNDPAQQKPKLRRIRGFPLQAKGPDGNPITLMGLADAQQISTKVVATIPAVQAVLPHMDGSKGLDEIVGAVGQGLQRPFLEQLVAQLADAALIEGAEFDRLFDEMRSQFDEADVLPPGSSVQFAEAAVMQKYEGKATDEQKAGEGATEMARVFDAWIDQALKDAESPAFDVLPPAVVAPHIDYPRGWVNYAHTYGRMRVAERPDRVIVLGTNHFGMATGVCGCDKGYETPFGVSRLDKPLFEALTSRLGEEQTEQLLRHKYDHEREHSIELHIPWIQHCLGKGEDGEYVPVFGALIHDPAVNNGESYDGEGLDLDPFIEAMKGAISEVGGRTLVISSADLSHAGPAFGDQQPLAGDTDEAKAARDRVTGHDREMLNLVEANKPDELVAAMAWQQNPTRWCSVGNLVATMKIVEPAEIKLLNYGAAMDQQGTTLVSHASLSMK